MVFVIYNMVGTGPTAVQAIPHLGAAAKKLYVFQRTPSSINVRNNFKTTPEYAAEYCSKPGWQRERVANFGECVEAPAVGQQDLANDGWTWSVEHWVGLLNQIGADENTQMELFCLSQAGEAGKLAANHIVAMILKKKANNEMVISWSRFLHRCSLNARHELGMPR